MSKMNSTVLRVKRKINDLPLISLMVGCKRPKTQNSSDSSDPDVQTIAEFAGTLLDRSKDFSTILTLNIMSFDMLYNSSKQSIDDENHLTKKAKWIDVDATVKKVKVSKYRNLSKKGEDEHSSNELGADSKDASQVASQNAYEEKWMTFIDMEDVWSRSFYKYVTKQNHYAYDLYYVKKDEDVWFDSDKIYVKLPEVWRHPFRMLNVTKDECSCDSNSDSEVDDKNRDNSEDKSTSENSDTSSSDDNLSLSSSNLFKIRSLYIDCSSSSSESSSLPLQNSDSEFDSDYHCDYDFY